MGRSLGQGGPGDAARGVRPGALSELLQEIAGAPTPSSGVSWELALRPGLAVGKFELVRELGSGGFGVVWEARDRELGRVVAFKAVRAGAKDRLREERLLREAEAAARLSHPNLVTLHDLGHSEHGPYLVLEMLRGQTLENRLAQGRLSLREAVRVAVEVAKGVAHAHAHGVVHRDLKPSNVFLCHDGQVKVLDFGLAHAFGQRRQEGGTPAYMAPEQWEGAPEDERTDVFALGVMLFGMLSGELPFPGDGARSAQGPRKAPLLEVPELPALGELVARMLEKRAAQRPRDGAEVAAALTSLQGELERAPGSGAPPVATRPRAGLAGLVSELRRRRVLPALVGYATFALVAVKGVDWLHDSGRLPGWGLTAALALLGLGFPATLLAAWFYELTGQGFRRAVSAGADAEWSRRGRLALLLAGLAVLTAVPGMVYYLQLRPRGVPPGKSQPSVAVLPFADMSPQKDQEYFSDGMAEEILNALAHVDGLRVIGRTSSFYFKGRNEDLASISRKLAVGAILEGSVRKDENRVRVTAQLIDAGDGSHLWSETYDRELTSVFRVQEEIARAVVTALQVKLLPDRAPTTRSAATASAEAYNLVLRSRDAEAALNREGYFKAHALLEQAAALDPAYATPHADMALTLRAMSAYAETPAKADELRQRALAEAEIAVRLGPELDDGYSIRALLRTMVSHDWAGAEADLRRALELSPSHQASLRRMGLLLAERGQVEEGIGYLLRSVQHDPLRAATWNWLGILQAAVGKRAEARASLGRSRELAPESPEPRGSLAFLEIEEGHPNAALALVPLLNEDDGLETIALAEYALGHDEASRRALETLIVRHGHKSAQAVAEVYAWRGEAGKAFEWLERARRQELYGVKYNPILARIRGDPRYAEFLRRMNLHPD